MKYILSEKEYKTLVRGSKTQTEELLLGCIKITCTTPILYWAHTEPEIWGCIDAEKIGSDKFSSYCDECIVQNICPKKNKKWSK